MRPYRQPPAKQRKRFVRLARKMLAGLGATPRELHLWESDGPAVDAREMLLETPAGTLTLTPYDGWVAGRFVDPRHARRFVDCNPYTGKWIHYWAGGAPELALAAIDGQLRTLLAYSDPAECRQP